MIALLTGHSKARRLVYTTLLLVFFPGLNLLMGWGKVLAQGTDSILFHYAVERIDTHAVWFTMKAPLPKGLHLYSLITDPEKQVGSFLKFDTVLRSRIRGGVSEAYISTGGWDSALSVPIHYFTDSVVWRQKLNIADTDSLLIKGSLIYLGRAHGQYVSDESSFRVYVHKTGSSPGSAPTPGPTIDLGHTPSPSLWWTFLLAFGGGLLALLTPCVYSMIPVTVSYFTKKSSTRKQGIRNALTYALSIVLIFTGLGFLITLIFGPTALNQLSTNWIANLVFFGLFVVFGLSFLGGFELRLPSSWINGTDSKASKISVGGIFFMALTLVLVSFSCTGPIIGNLLVLASRGSILGPLVGMFGFSAALGLPFALFAFFPGKLHVLGKAGGWLNALKVSLGFLELALALKFLSNADLMKGWRMLDRDVFLCAWIVLFGLLGFYLLGKIKLHHDDELPSNDFGRPYLTTTRLVLAIAVLIFTLYLIPGLWGAPLKGVSAFLPPMGTQDFSLSNAPTGARIREGQNDTALKYDDTPVKYDEAPIKYAEQMKMYEPQVVAQLHLRTYYDYNQALAEARKEHKPLMLDFTGINCSNCRKMESEVWSDPQVLQRLRNDFVIASLYVDARNIDLQESELYQSPASHKQIDNLGDKNADLQISRFGTSSMPCYYFLGTSEQPLTNNGYGYDPDIKKFAALLDSVVNKFHQS